MIYLTNQQWDIRLKTIATKRLKKFKRALNATSMGRYFNLKAIVEIQDGILVIDEAAYRELRKLFMRYSDDELRKRNIIA
jgi:hypothetical protein